MGEFEVWVYRGAIIVLLAVLWYLAKGVLKELRLIRDALESLHITQTAQDGTIRLVGSRVDSHENRINDHASRLRGIERKQDSCQYCKEA
ncbi:MAG: hypothetical protein NTW16_05735 [Bacteroidetes bacterium]|nr:hypothetical protein [Bacteroidota bacterium]